jgi:capsular polysaccharide biosynthesis protein
MLTMMITLTLGRFFGLPGVIVGLVIGVGFALIQTALTPRIRGKDDTKKVA